MIHVYTGNGKGKTTAALGLALRASGAGMKVYIAQFLKGRPCSELTALKKLSRVKVEQFGRGCFIRRKPKPKDIALAQNGLVKVKKAICANIYQMVILDEINIALKLRLINQKELIALLKNANPGTEIILTGRYAPKKIIALADLVSEIKEKKHYFRKGIRARKGIEF